MIKKWTISRSSFKKQKRTFQSKLIYFKKQQMRLKRKLIRALCLLLPNLYIVTLLQIYKPRLQVLMRKLERQRGKEGWNNFFLSRSSTISRMYQITIWRSLEQLVSILMNIKYNFYKPISRTILVISFRSHLTGWHTSPHRNYLTILQPSN